MYLNGLRQWEAHKLGRKHRLNTRPLLTAADAEGAAQARWQWRQWAESQETPEEGEEESRLRADLEAERGRAQAVDAAEEERRRSLEAEHTAAVALAQQGLAEEEVERSIRWVEHEEEALVQMAHLAVESEVASVRRWEVAPARQRAEAAEQWFAWALAERKAWRQKAKGFVKAANEARWAAAGARAAAAAALAAAGPIVVD